MQKMKVYGSVEHQREAMAIELIRRGARSIILSTTTRLTTRRLQTLSAKIGETTVSTRGPLPQISEVFVSDAERVSVRIYAPVYCGFAADPRAGIDVYAMIKAHDFCKDTIGLPIHIDYCWYMSRDIRNGHIFRKKCACSQFFFVCGGATTERCKLCQDKGEPCPNPREQFPREQFPRGSAAPNSRQGASS